MRQGIEPRGIIAAGYAISTPYETIHWEEERRRRGEMALQVGIRFERLLNPAMDDPLPLATLIDGPLASVHWRTQASGIDVGDAAEELERLWAEHLARFDSGHDEPAAREGELRIAMNRHRARERYLRDARIEAAKLANRGRLLCEVPGCAFDFFEVYGDIGRVFAQVHHLKPLGDRTRASLTKLSDLAVVCANCHAMIHVGGQCRPLEGLIAAPHRRL